MSANIRDIEVIREFRVRLLRFVEEVEGALEAMQMELHRSFEWMEQDRPHYWATQMRTAHDLLESTRTAYQLCRMRTVAGHRSSCIEEQSAHEKAKRRLQHVQDQVERTRRWAIKIRHQGDEFRGRLAGIRRLLDSEIPQALAYLERSAAILEQYADLAPPGDSPTAPSP